MITKLMVNTMQDPSARLHTAQLTPAVLGVTVCEPSPLDSNFPGGPDMYWKENISVWCMDWAMTAVILRVLRLMIDGLMVGRARRCRNECSFAWC